MKQILIVLALGLPLVTALGGWSEPEAQADHLVTLQYVGSPPPDAWITGIHHRTAWMYMYQDLSPGPWEFWMQYRNCAQTPQGAMTLTLYRSPMKVGSVTPKARFAHKRRYSLTITKTKRSDRFDYVFPGSTETSYYLHVVVPSRSGCGSWQFGTMGN